MQVNRLALTTAGADWIRGTYSARPGFSSGGPTGHGSFWTFENAELDESSGIIFADMSIRRLEWNREAQADIVGDWEPLGRIALGPSAWLTATV